MINKRFDKLVVLREAPSYISRSKKGKISYRKRYYCRCDCGFEFSADGTRLRSNKIKRCAYCSYKLRPQSINRYTSEERLYKLQIEGRCKKSNIENQLTLQEFTELIKQNCYYCECPPKIVNHLLRNKHVKRNPIKANGIDRKDSSIGYIMSNCVPCCWDCNRMKGVLTINAFYDKIEQILYKRKK